MLLDVKMRFESEIRKGLSKRPDVLKFVMNHERKEMVLRNVCNEIVLAETKFGAKMDTRRFNTIVDSVAKQFTAMAIREKLDKQLSNNEKQRRIDESQKMERLEEEFQMKDVSKSLKDTDT